MGEMIICKYGEMHMQYYKHHLFFGDIKKAVV